MKATNGFAMEALTGKDFASCVQEVKTRLEDVGFGVLTEIDVQATLKKKLGVDKKPFLILGACNPPFAHQALELEPLISVLLPCNVVIMDEGDHRRVACMDPGMMSQVVDHPELAPIATEVQNCLAKVLREIAD